MILRSSAFGRWFGHECRALINGVVVQSHSRVQLFAARRLQHIRALCLSPSPEVCPSSCPLHQWCHPAISSSDALFSSASIFLRAGLKLFKKKTKIMAFGPITSCQIEGGNVEVVTDFLFLVFSSKITVNGDCSHEIRWLLLDRKAMTNLDSVLKSRHCTANRGPYSQSYSLPSGHVWL